MTKFYVRTLSALLAAMAAAVCCTVPALADDVPDNTFRLGLYSVFYHTTTDGLTGPYVPAGVSLDAKNLETMYAAYVRRLSSIFDLEFAAGWPPLSKTVGRGPATLGSVPYAGQEIASARWISPTVLLNYKFLGENYRFHPYIGAGVNYTTFYDRDSTAAGNAASGGPTKLDLSRSLGPAATLGTTYTMTRHWNFMASYSYARVNTHLVADTAGIIRTTDIKFGPQTFVVAVGFSF
jgi:outer membrane protein